MLDELHHSHFLISIMSLVEKMEKAHFQNPVSTSRILRKVLYYTVSRYNVTIQDISFESPKERLIIASLRSKLKTFMDQYSDFVEAFSLKVEASPITFLKDFHFIYEVLCKDQKIEEALILAFLAIVAEITAQCLLNEPSECVAQETFYQAWKCCEKVFEQYFLPWIQEQGSWDVFLQDSPKNFLIQKYHQFLFSCKRFIGLEK